MVTGRAKGYFKKGNNAGKKFEKGKSGNPTGVSRLQAQYKAAFDAGMVPDVVAEAVAAMRAAVATGDMTAVKMVLDRTIGPLPDGPKVAVNVLNVVPPVETRAQVSRDEWEAMARAIKDGKP